MSQASPRAHYESARALRAEALRGLEARANAIASARLVVAALAVGLLLGIVWGGFGGPGWAGLLVSVLVFVVLVAVHARVHANAEYGRACVRFYEQGLQRLGGKWKAFPRDGARFALEEHPYADDLDLFGRGSLFQRIDDTTTRFGEARLVAWLDGSERETNARIEERQAAVRELAGKVEFRERLRALGALLGEREPKADPSPFLTWAEDRTEAWAGGAPAWVKVAARVLPVVTVGFFVVQNQLGGTRLWWVLGLIAELALLGLTGRQVGPAAAAIASKEVSLARFADLLAHVESATFEAPRLRALQQALATRGVRATTEMARLGRLVSFLEARQNEVWRLFIGQVLLWDLNLVVLLDGWRARVGPSARTWLVALGEVEALSSLAAFAFDEPGFAYPTWAEAPCFVAEGLAHPLLDAEARVANDVTLGEAGATLVVTGSNMSGKSTLLRSIGVNAVLARAGAPVCARALALGPVEVVTSMRVRDSLTDGVSRFYAEVRKLKRVIDHARGPAPTLFLLDEILHGTNSRERLIGARALVRELVSTGAVGAVSTHDLAIGDLEESLAGKVKNVHFEEQVSNDTMTFDYRLRPGVVQSSNALRIMKMVGIDFV